MKFQPLHDRVLVERLDQSETERGIIIPDTAKEKPTRGMVIEVGAGVRSKKGELIPLDIKVGDKILFAKWGGTEIKLGKKEYLIMKESDILGTIKE
jgi:chaperonin GroES